MANPADARSCQKKNCFRLSFKTVRNFPEKWETCQNFFQGVKNHLHPGCCLTFGGFKVVSVPFHPSRPSVFQGE